MKNFRFLLIPFFMLCLLGCSFSNAEKEYEHLISKFGNAESEEIFSLIYEFEIKYPNHFLSKIHLAELFMLQENYISALQYLDRAEKCFQDNENHFSKQDSLKLYSLLSQVNYVLKDYKKAGQYAEKISATNNYKNSTWGYFSALAFYLSGEETKAYDVFTANYELVSDFATAQDLQLYLILLANQNNFEQGKIIFQKYFEVGGSWFIGLGKIGSIIFQSDANISKLLLCLDYEIIKSYLTEKDALAYSVDDFINEVSVSDFSNSINKDLFNDAAIFVQSIENESTLYEYEMNFPNNFCGIYWKAKNNLKTNTLSDDDLINLLKIENVFCKSPSYYWLVWEIAKKLYSNSTPKKEINSDMNNQFKNYIPVLKKIIALNPSGIYANKARNELSNFLLVQDELDYNNRLDLVLF